MEQSFGVGIIAGTSPPPLTRDEKAHENCKDPWIELKKKVVGRENVD